MTNEREAPQKRHPREPRDPVLIDLALQGGGSHGAFTWGVLDRLMDEPWLGIDGISRTSAGAMNAVVLRRRPARAHLLDLKARLLLARARPSVADPGTISARSNAH
jgi:predicted acylesterase/phospholipase RssA